MLQKEVFGQCRGHRKSKQSHAKEIEGKNSFTSIFWKSSESMVEEWI